MPGTDLDIHSSYLTRVQALYPGAVGIGRISGSRHVVVAQKNKMVKTGEIIAIERFARVDNRAGLIEIPYVRMKTHEQVRRERRARAAAVVAGGLMLAVAVGWLLWQAREAIVLACVAVMVIPGALYLCSHWRNGCSGIHCSGCKG